MYYLVKQIAKTLNIPMNLIHDSSFYSFFHDWYFYNHHNWEYIPSTDWSSSEGIHSEEIDWIFHSDLPSEGDILESCHTDSESYISDSGSDYDLADFESYYYQYVECLLFLLSLFNLHHNHLLAILHSLS